MLFALFNPASVAVLTMLINVRLKLSVLGMVSGCTGLIDVKKSAEFFN